MPITLLPVYGMIDSLTQLHHALVDAMARSRHDPPDQPVTVAEIYQDLIPYRTVRATVGFVLNEDYEHALLQLLAGEGGYARVEPEEVQAELRMELKATHPNVGVFRNYAACDVFVTIPEDFERRRARARSGDREAERAASVIERGPQAAAPAPVVRANGENQERKPAPAAQGPVLQRPEPSPGPAPARPAVAAPTPIKAPAPTPPQRSAAPSAATGTASASQKPAAAATAQASCNACSKTLPAGRTVRFCPHCGQDQTRRACTNCGEQVEAGWQFCIACGAAAK